VGRLCCVSAYSCFSYKPKRFKVRASRSKTDISMKKRLFLHVGMPKCATTTVQDFLATHAGDLAARGIHYEFHRQNRVNDQGNAGQLAADLLRGDTTAADALLAFFLRHDGDVILSSENLFGLARSALIQEVIERIRTLGFEVGIICFLRRQDMWIESDYKQHVKGGVDWRDGIDALLQFRSEKQVLNYNWMLVNWAKSVGRENVLAVPLIPGQHQDYPVRAFLEAIGASDLLPEGEQAGIRRNISPPTGLIEPARYLKKAMLDQGMSMTMTTRTIETFFKRAPLELEVPSRRFLVSFARRHRILNICAQYNEALARNFFDEVDHFGRDLEEDPASEEPLSKEAAALLAAYHIRHRAGLRITDRALRGLSAARARVMGPRFRS